MREGRLTVLTWGVHHPQLGSSRLFFPSQRHKRSGWTAPLSIKPAAPAPLDHLRSASLAYANGIAPGPKTDDAQVSQIVWLPPLRLREQTAREAEELLQPVKNFLRTSASQRCACA